MRCMLVYFFINLFKYDWYFIFLNVLNIRIKKTCTKAAFSILMTSTTNMRNLKLTSTPQTPNRMPKSPACERLQRKAKKS